MEIKRKFNFLSNSNQKMNIFFLHYDPKKCAQYHLDKHVVKMILETAQMLYSVHWVLELNLPDNAYKKTHVNHPCSIWARSSQDNYIWLCNLGIELCEEYTFRYEKVHKTQKHIEWLKSNIPEIPKLGLTTPYQAMPDEYKDSDPIQGYKNFYIKNKMILRGITKYTKRETPEWVKF
jgi:hypothetical protein